MLKTNSKKAMENIKKYIIENFTPYDGEEVNVSDFSAVARYIKNTVFNEKIKYSFERGRRNDFYFFEDWCQGLPSVLDTCYYYNRSAADDLSIILEESDAEKAKYQEKDAEELLTRLIFREIYKIN